MSKKTRRRRRESVTRETIDRKEKFKYQLILEGIAVGPVSYTHLIGGA